MSKLSFKTELDIIPAPEPKLRLAKPATGIYAPISSVWEGTDGKLLDAILDFYPAISPEPILDATYNTGRIWIGAKKRKIVSMDIDKHYKPMIVADNRTMVGVPSAAYAVVVYDPPHVGPQGRDKSRKRFDVDFGATVECGKEQDWNLSYLYPPFLEQARRVLKPNGLLLAKIAEQLAAKAGMTVVGPSPQFPNMPEKMPEQNSGPELVA